jgi:hypothetical protein
MHPHLEELAKRLTVTQGTHHRQVVVNERPRWPAVQNSLDVTGQHFGLSQSMLGQVRVGFAVGGRLAVSGSDHGRSLNCAPLTRRFYWESRTITRSRPCPHRRNGSLGRMANPSSCFTPLSQTSQVLLPANPIQLVRTESLGTRRCRPIRATQSYLRSVSTSSGSYY